MKFFITLLVFQFLSITAAKQPPFNVVPSHKKPSKPHQPIVNQGHSYTIQDMYQGDSFLNQDDWTFFSQDDPTHGLVNYQSLQDAKTKQLAFVDHNGATHLIVDNTTHLPAGSKRDSIRIMTTKSYSSGLFIADFSAMPYGCGIWPAYWTVGPNWPNAGEIDIIEGINEQSLNQYTFHSNPDCTIPTSENLTAIGNRMGSQCATINGDNSGCGFQDQDSRSYGKGFNDADGGVFAHLWDDTSIQVWFFTRSKIPRDITMKNPKPTQWGPPVAILESANCNITDHFFEHQIILNTDICGDWAGDAYPKSGCPGTCQDRVSDPGNFATAQWIINYIAVYQ